MTSAFAVGAGKASSWRAVLADPGEHGHIVQMYQDSEFLGEAVSYFAAEGIARGESIILVPTAPHWQIISARLRAMGLSATELKARGQLTVFDAHEAMPSMMNGSMPDEAGFRALAGNAIEKARAGGKYRRVRWWGEVVNLLALAGNARASNRLEVLCTDVARQCATPIFCSFLLDKYDPRTYDGSFGAICRTHDHLIPADDYALQRHAVSRAITEVIGDPEGPLLRSFMAWRGPACRMPAPQAALLWVRDLMPRHFAGVLAKAKKIERESHGPGHC